MSSYDHFETVIELRQSILWGGEVSFAYQGETYGIFRTEHELLLTHKKTEIPFSDMDALLNYTLNGERLIDVLLKAEITWRKI